MLLIAENARKKGEFLIHLELSWSVSQNQFLSYLNHIEDNVLQVNVIPIVLNEQNKKNFILAAGLDHIGIWPSIISNSSTWGY